MKWGQRDNIFDSTSRQDLNLACGPHIHCHDCVLQHCQGYQSYCPYGKCKSGGGGGVQSPVISFAES